MSGSKKSCRIRLASNERPLFKRIAYHSHIRASDIPNSGREICVDLVNRPLAAEVY